jgi:glutamate-5-semialdehyde dehydrogenase
MTNKEINMNDKEWGEGASHSSFVNLHSLFTDAKTASHDIALLSDDKRKSVLNAVADRICAETEMLLAANAEDTSLMSKDNPLYDRLLLTSDRLNAIAEDMRHVASLPSPLGKITIEKTLQNGLHLRRISVPFGVIGMIYEARPNVTFDVFSLCFKSGNVCVLKGGRDAEASNRAAVKLIHSVLESEGINTSAVVLLPSTHEATAEMLNAVGYIDLCIPRGGKRLIQFVRDNAKVPVIETGAGVVNTYFDERGDVTIGARIINNAKTRRVSVCNALDCLIIHNSRLNDLPALCSPLKEHNVKLIADTPAYKALENKYPAGLLSKADNNTFGTEFMDYILAIRTVDSLDEALLHIAKYGSGHSECIITDDEAAAKKFQEHVDAACVYVNAPTSFTDGAQFGLGAEIGISTQKLGPRGPMGLEEMTTYKWLIDGQGQIRN